MKYVIIAYPWAEKRIIDVTDSISGASINAYQSITHTRIDYVLLNEQGKTFLKNEGYTQ